MADAVDSHNIARRTFEVARRGYDQHEVRGYLHEVGALVERLQREVVQLRERAERAEARLELEGGVDEAMLIEVLGEETTRVLTSAREAAAEIRAKAEAAAERIVADATAEASDTRAEAIRDAERRLADAASQHDALMAEARGVLDQRQAEAQEAAALIRAEASEAAQALRDEGQRELDRAKEAAAAEIEAARDEGKRMVAEAQAVRERVLRDLSARRKKARQQVEKLNAGRERLLEAYAVVRRTIDEATGELSTSLSDARLAADAAARRIEEEPEPSLEQLDEEVRTAGLVDLPIADHLGAEPDGDHDHDDDSPGPLSGEVPAVTERAEATPAVDEGEDGRDAPVEETAAEQTPGSPPPPTDLGERRSRKRRKRETFEGLPAGELTRVEPPAEGEGVRVIAEPAVEPSPAGSADPADQELVESEPAPGAVTDGLTDETDDEVPDGDVDDAADAATDDDTTDAAIDDATTADDDGGATAADDAATAGGTATDATDDAVEEHAPEPDEPGAADTSVDDLFARLRAGQDREADDAELTVEVEVVEVTTVEVTEDEVLEVIADAEASAEPVSDEADADTTVEEPTPFTARDELLEPIDKELARRLKRALADEQNEVLDTLRRSKPKGVDDLLPDADAHAARWAEVVTAALEDAAAAGAHWSGGTAGTVAELADELAQSLTAPLRDRIDRSFAAVDGNLDDVADRVRALYREWKGQRLTETSSHYAAAAYARGVFDGTAPGTTVHWVVDPSGGRCPDCDDNVLGGEMAKGDEFPTGHVCAPAHPGCRCLVLAADR